MKLVDSTPVIKIEDILPFFPDFVIIDDFKEEICTALEGYSAHIDQLKAEMDEATRTAEAIKQDIINLQNRFVTLDANEKCVVCGQALLTRQFYVFPCQHNFHADCLIGQVRCCALFWKIHALTLLLFLGEGIPTRAIFAPIGHSAECSRPATSRARSSDDPKPTRNTSDNRWRNPSTSSSTTTNSIIIQLQPTRSDRAAHQSSITTCQQSATYEP